MAKKPNYGFEKRMKEMARKQKKEEKQRLRRELADEKRNEPGAEPVDGEPDTAQE
ncbi:MAG TPA: hypothetical protein VNE60_09235 [Gemmatimonadaceae bacterium]|nr:hypothetical protein [Gemmatimonadaceae bacterium]